MFPIILSAQPSNNSIKIRKLNYDTISYEETFTDSISSYVYTNRYGKGKITNPRYNGFLNDYVLIKGNRLYVFNKAISERDQRKSAGRKTRGRFWKKMKRLKQRNKIHYFKISFLDSWVDSINKEFENDYDVFDVFHDNEKIAEDVKRTKIADTENIITNTKVYARYIILKDTFHILTRNNDFSQNSVWSTNVLLNLNSELTQTENESIFTLNLTCPKSINYDNYEFKFDLKNSGKNVVKIIKNEAEEFICPYKIKGKYIYIENPPIPGFAKGRIDNKISKIKFKIHTANHIYSMKQD